MPKKTQNDNPFVTDSFAAPVGVEGPKALADYFELADSLEAGTMTDEDTPYNSDGSFPLLALPAPKHPLLEKFGVKEKKAYRDQNGTIHDSQYEALMVGFNEEIQNAIGLVIKSKSAADAVYTALSLMENHTAIREIFMTHLELLNFRDRENETEATTNPETNPE